MASEVKLKRLMVRVCHSDNRGIRFDRHNNQVFPSKEHQFKALVNPLREASQSSHLWVGKRQPLVAGEIRCRISAMAEIEVSIEAQKYALIPYVITEALNGLRPSRGRTKWWEGRFGAPMGLRAMSLVISLTSPYERNVNVLVGDPWVLEGGKFEVTKGPETRVARVEFKAGNQKINLGNPLSSGELGNTMLTLGGMTLTEKQRGALSPGVLSRHLAYFPSPTGLEFPLGIAVIGGRGDLAVVTCEKEMEPESDEVLKLLVPWAYGLVERTVPPYQERG